MYGGHRESKQDRPDNLDFDLNLSWFPVSCLQISFSIFMIIEKRRSNWNFHCRALVTVGVRVR